MVTVELPTLSRAGRGSHAWGAPSDAGIDLTSSMGHGVWKQKATTIALPMSSRESGLERLMHLDFSRGHDMRRDLLAAPGWQLALRGLPAMVH